jgi:hypothetical protein
MNITCRRCGHHWREMPVLELNDLKPSRAPSIIEHEPEPDIDVEALLQAARQQGLTYAQKRRAKLLRLGGWAAFAAVAGLPFLVAGIAPATTVMAAPITYRAYQRLGWPVNIYGLDIRKIEQHYQSLDGKRELLIKGEVSNPSNDVRKIPWLRFALTDGHGTEVYTWTLDTAARPLRPGESTSFTTRLAAPPEYAKNLQIRFAHGDEIGSNGT